MGRLESTRCLSTLRTSRISSGFGSVEIERPGDRPPRLCSNCAQLMLKTAQNGVNMRHSGPGHDPSQMACFFGGKESAPGVTRTPDLWIRSRSYPLRVQVHPVVRPQSPLETVRLESRLLSVALRRTGSRTGRKLSGALGLGQSHGLVDNRDQDPRDEHLQQTVQHPSEDDDIRDRQ